jgi:hypothetical protein
VNAASYFKSKKGKLDIMISDEDMKGLSGFVIPKMMQVIHDQDDDEIMYKTPGED